MSRAPSPWGWGLPQRAALVVLACSGSVVLLLGSIPGRQAPSSPPPPAFVSVDLNSAPPAVLLALPGLGPSRVDRILDARADRPFESLDDVERRVKGIGPATIRGIEPWARVEPPGG